ncbi:MAG TPA: exodeoxyribonuclease VII large subunit, partial [Firmicutes bacterium]|nr:exodeoxyribonuclease VII large subunit [Bacillota bacterium]
CDFVADARAATPTAAARLVIPDGRRLASELARQRRRLAAAVAALVDSRRSKLDHLASRPILSRPLQILLQPRQNLDLGAYRFKTVFT